ncbi:sensor histidine kinase [Kitasatospora sp. NPDC093806]|uniref:sensor histidine kinase n=1 Tax=Kitasatospora sp. NPDC093806 TaxID=3155075 RepID=UPI00343D8569
MRRVVSWLEGACTGFLRACAVLAVGLAVPAVWAGAVAWGIRWGAGNPWSWLLPVLLVCGGTFALSRPVCRAVRFLVARWTGTVVPAGYRQPGPVTQLSTGYWWNGHGYERTARDARLDQAWRLRWGDPATWRDLRFTAVLPVTAGLVAAVPPTGVAVAAVGLAQPVAFGFARSALPGRLVGAFGLLVAVAAAPYAWRCVEPVAVRFLRPSRAMALTDRVAELTAQRADTTIAQAAEIRRIERDLHDGAQARLVALGMSLATAERLMDSHPEQARALMREARAGAAGSLAELRELVRGINPPVLSDRGLVDAVRALALNSPLEVAVSAEEVRFRLEPPIESALYFGTAELLTNAARHARASRVRISIVRDGGGVVVELADDGRGGAVERADGGLAGLRRRLAVFDGSLEVSSPVGGPTTARMMVPCESW